MTTMKEKRTITMAQINESGTATWSRKDSSPRGYSTVPTEDLCLGDKVLIDNYWHQIVPEPCEIVLCHWEDGSGYNYEQTIDTMDGASVLALNPAEWDDDDWTSSYPDWTDDPELDGSRLECRGLDGRVLSSYRILNGDTRSLEQKVLDAYYGAGSYDARLHLDHGVFVYDSYESFREELLSSAHTEEDVLPAWEAMPEVEVDGTVYRFDVCL